MDEVWKEITNYPDYKVSNIGRVKSFKCRKEKILRPGTNNKGYLVVVLSNLDKRKTFSVHQLVAMAFLNHTPNGHKIVIDHIDSDKTNNRNDNLQLVTTRDNACKELYQSKGSIGIGFKRSQKKWRAQIRIDGKQKHLGYFTSKEEAQDAYYKYLEEVKIKPCYKNLAGLKDLSKRTIKNQSLNCRG